MKQPENNVMGNEKLMEKSQKKRNTEEQAKKQLKNQRGEWCFMDFNWAT